ncbi:putative aldouronate transport system permease protein [Butyrivibrio proteoclasticus]|uniref:Putative aldouronate transport system permease protein n=2 Tax=Butyrivibrio proteoclasticus TaxID=43305 RepID=A0A1I5WG67_9FIRM|nr:putative aldouronate transport system permease protein [Butyrivibrio proteoclasticus]
MTMRTREERNFQIFAHVVMMILSLLAVVPFVLLVISSFTDNDVLIADGYSFTPAKWSTYAYEYIFKTGNSVVHAYGISIVLTLIGTALALSITTLLAYALSKPDLPFRSVLLFLVFFTLLFNGGLVPTYIVYSNMLNIKNSFWALLVPGLLMNGFNVMLMKSYFCSSIPTEILDAAYIDGASEYKTFLSVVLPLSKPIVATIGLFAGIAYWNDWMNGYIYLTKRTDLYSVQNLLNRMMQNIQYLSQNSSRVQDAGVGLASIPSVSVRMAMATVGVLPILVSYPFIQGNFVKGITLGGVKG